MFFNMKYSTVLKNGVQFTASITTGAWIKFLWKFNCSDEKMHFIMIKSWFTLANHLKDTCRNLLNFSHPFLSDMKYNLNMPKSSAPNVEQFHDSSHFLGCAMTFWWTLMLWLLLRQVWERLLSSSWTNKPMSSRPLPDWPYSTNTSLADNAPHAAKDATGWIPWCGDLVIVNFIY